MPEPETHRQIAYAAIEVQRIVSCRNGAADSWKNRHDRSVE